MSPNVNHLLNLPAPEPRAGGRAVPPASRGEFEAQLRKVAVEIDAARSEPQRSPANSRPGNDRIQAAVRGRDDRSDRRRDVREETDGHRDAVPAAGREAAPEVTAPDSEQPNPQTSADDATQVERAATKLQQTDGMSLELVDDTTGDAADQEPERQTDSEFSEIVVGDALADQAAQTTEVTGADAKKAVVETADQPLPNSITPTSENAAEPTGAQDALREHAVPQDTSLDGAKSPADEAAFATTHEDAAPHEEPASPTISKVAPNAATANGSDTDSADEQGERRDGEQPSSENNSRPQGVLGGATPHVDPAAEAAIEPTANTPLPAGRSESVVHDSQPAAHHAPAASTAVGERAAAPAELAAGPPEPASSPGPRVDAARFVSRVARAFQAAEQRGGTVQLRLSPPELGALRIELSVQQGTLTAKLETETAAAKSVLLDNLPALRERLAAQDIRVEKFEVDVRQQGSGGQPDRQERQAEQRERQPPPATTTNRSSATDVREEPRRTVTSRGVAEGAINVVA